ncbi:ABC-2 family transporter protein [Glycomyces sp. TRM65418]|uniref:ABC transporter permease n=1 Tax=Glycomyces sp. TRM65418 TaxID=2867006 RepID=UPI001CE4FCE7|nr:ABC-2 family transporter protein [Glycomyces sp. TRM65418]MCC3764309.1 ABC-2 family transporter protein [Glycomyces sp. TRM65418]QZD53990.1 ABC-2 family transporter protein [Glycomyces sp. TRM65418]
MSHAHAVDRALVVVSFKRRLAYKSQWALGLALGGGSMLIAMAMWHNLLGSGTLAGYDWDSMRAYTIIGFVAATMVFGAADFQMADRILDGHIAVDLTKPVDFQRARAAEYIGSMISTAPTAVAGVLGAWLLFDPPGPATPLAGALTAVSFALVFPLAFGITYLSVLVCFWTKRYLGVMWLREALLSFFSGLMIPLAFMPGWLQTLAWALPFPHFTTTPAVIYLGRVDTAGALGLIAAEAAWAVGLWFLGRLVFRHAVKKVTVHGG